MRNWVSTQKVPFDYPKGRLLANSTTVFLDARGNLEVIQDFRSGYRFSSTFSKTTKQTKTPAKIYTVRQLQRLSVGSEMWRQPCRILLPATFVICDDLASGVTSLASRFLYCVIENRICKSARETLNRCCFWISEIYMVNVKKYLRIFDTAQNYIIWSRIPDGLFWNSYFVIIKAHKLLLVSRYNRRNLIA